MPTASATTSTHVERHFTGSATVRDVVIGMSDGLTVPFALAAGLSGSIGDPFVVVVAGIVAKYGLDGLFTCTLMAGVLLIIMGITGLIVVLLGAKLLLLM